MQNTIEIKGHTYGVGIMPADKQFHVARRIAPIFASLGLSVEALKAGGREQLDPATMMTSLGPVAQVLAAMSDETIDYVTSHCLAVVTRRQVLNGGKEMWAPVARGTQLMFADIQMPEMIRLVVEAVLVNLMGFTSEAAAPQSSTAS
jgi:hypothetical protein